MRAVGRARIRFLAGRFPERRGRAAGAEVAGSGGFVELVVGLNTLVGGGIVAVEFGVGAVAVQVMGLPSGRGVEVGGLGMMGAMAVAVGVV